jgi:hypothetical protein
MIHYKETDVAIKWHEGELTSAVVVYNAGNLTGKCSKAEDLGDQVVINVIDDVVGWVDVRDDIVIILGGFYKTWHDGIRDWDGEADMSRLWCSATDAFVGSLHVTFWCSRTRWEVFRDGFLREMWSTTEESLANSCK